MTVQYSNVQDVENEDSTCEWTPGGGMPAARRDEKLHGDYSRGKCCSERAFAELRYHSQCKLIKFFLSIRWTLVAESLDCTPSGSIVRRTLSVGPDML